MSPSRVNPQAATIPLLLPQLERQDLRELVQSARRRVVSKGMTRCPNLSGLETELSPQLGSNSAGFSSDSRNLHAGMLFQLNILDR
jgi:hypothetical protein